MFSNQAVIIICIGGQGHRFIKRLNDNWSTLSDRIRYIGIDTKFTSNHYENQRPEYIEPERFICLDKF